MLQNSIHLGDCLDVMKSIPDGSIDMILCDPPYGTTACKWDVVIPLEPMWRHYKRIIKDNGVIVLFGSQPFSSALVMSNLDMFKYEWVWQKSKCVNFAQAKNMPLKFTESVLIFSKASIGHHNLLGESRMKYNPQGIVKVDKKWSRPKSYENGHLFSRKSHKLERVIEFENYPTNIVKLGNSSNKERGLHPTQKPVSLMEYFIKTYTEEGDIVLDNCAGSGTTGIACLNLKRKYILIESERKYYDVIMKRLADHE